MDAPGVLAAVGVNYVIMIFGKMPFEGTDIFVKATWPQPTTEFQVIKSFEAGGTGSLDKLTVTRAAHDDTVAEVAQTKGCSKDTVRLPAPLAVHVDMEDSHRVFLSGTGRKNSSIVA